MERIKRTINRCQMIMVAITISVFASCVTDTVPSPVYDYEITVGESLSDIDWGDSGRLTPDGNYCYAGIVTLYNEDGGSAQFYFYTGLNGWDKGCRGVIYDGMFYNLDRNDWVTIEGIRFKASNVHN